MRDLGGSCSRTTISTTSACCGGWPRLRARRPVTPGHPECLRMTYQFDGAYREYYRGCFGDGRAGERSDVHPGPRAAPPSDVYSVDRFLADGSVLDGFTIASRARALPTDTLFSTPRGHRSGRPCSGHGDAQSHSPAARGRER